MADNVAITAGAGTTLASDDIGGVQYPRAKLSLGADGTAVDAGAGAGAVGTDTQRVTLGSDDPAVAGIGGTADAAATAGSTGSMSAKLRLMTSQLNTLAGTNSQLPTALGATTAAASLSVTQATDNAYSASASFTSGTTAYAAQDAVGASGASAVLTFASIGPSGGRIFITKCALRIDSSALISGQTSYVLHLYSGSPDVINDSAAWDLVANDRAEYLGNIPIPTPTDYGSTLWAELDLTRQVKLAAASTTIYGYLVTVGAYTPTAQVYTVFLESVNAS